MERQIATLKDWVERPIQQAAGGHKSMSDARGERQVRLHALAAELGCTPMTIRNFMSGKTSPNAEERKKIVDFASEDLLFHVKGSYIIHTFEL